MHVANGCGSVLLLQHCDALRTSGFVDDSMFSYSGPNGSVTIPQHRHCNVVSHLRQHQAPRLDKSFVQGLLRVEDVCLVSLTLRHAILVMCIYSTDEELSLLKAEFSHHAEKLDEYEQMRKEIDRLEGSHICSVADVYISF